MKLCDFGFLADENIHARLVEHLRHLGWSVLAVRETTLAGADDVKLPAMANADNRIVITHDSDFGQLAIASLAPMIGIVYLRPGHIDPKFTIETVETLISMDLDVSPPFIIVAKRSGDRVHVRVRSL